MGRIHAERLNAPKENAKRRENTINVLTHHWLDTPWSFWSGLVLLMVSSTGLEWTRLYRFDHHLPGHYAGGVLGYLTGSFGVQWLGFNGSGLIFIIFMIVGGAWVFRFSWVELAENLGAQLDDWFVAFKEKREIAQDLAMGQAAAKEREEISMVERIESIGHTHVTKLVYEPETMAVPKSARIARERQKPLFTDLPDSNLPQVDLLDSSAVRQDTVSPDTLEMTSRLI